MIAIFDNLSGAELAIGGVLAIMLFGKDLPGVAAKAAVQLQRLRRQMFDLRREMGIDEHLREAQSAMREAMAEAERQARKDEYAQLSAANPAAATDANGADATNAPAAAGGSNDAAAAKGAAPSESAHALAAPAADASAPLAPRPVGAPTAEAHESQSGAPFPTDTSALPPPRRDASFG